MFNASKLVYPAAVASFEVTIAGMRTLASKTSYAYRTRMDPKLIMRDMSVLELEGFRVHPILYT